MKKDKTHIMTCMVVGVSFAGIILQCFYSILGFIAVSLFKPLWEKIISVYKNEKTKT